MKKSLTILTFLFGLNATLGQDFDAKNSIGQSVYLNHNLKQVNDNIYKFNDEYKTTTMYRMKDVNFSSLSKFKIFNTPLKLIKVLPAPAYSDLILELTDGENKFLYFYDIRFPNQILLEFNEDNKTDSTYFDPLIFNKSDKTIYPEGLYLTKEDFLNKKVTKLNISPFNKGRMGKEELKGNEKSFYFQYSETQEQVRKYFAISYKGNLYIRSGSIEKYRNKKDKSHTALKPNKYTKVLYIGSDYLYLEFPFANKWGASLLMNISPVLYGVTLNTTPIIWDYKNDEFNLFRSNKDFNSFLEIKGLNKYQTKENKKDIPFIPYTRKVFDDVIEK